MTALAIKKSVFLEGQTSGTASSDSGSGTIPSSGTTSTKETCLQEHYFYKLMTKPARMMAQIWISEKEPWKGKKEK